MNGNVVIDDRLFAAYGGFPDGLISPIWVNENLIDLLVTPGAVGHRAAVRWRPMTASYTVTNRVTTVAARKPTTLNIAEPAPGGLVVTGQIAAGSPPTLRVWEVDHPPEFARTAFIEALQRAGVTVTAPATGPNPVALLPPKGSYRAADRVGQHVSATLAQFAKLILKVSYNRGADLMVCLAAVRIGSTSCPTGWRPRSDRHRPRGAVHGRVPVRRRGLQTTRAGPPRRPCHIAQARRPDLATARPFPGPPGPRP